MDTTMEKGIALDVDALAGAIRLAGLTQSEVSRRASIHPNTVTAWMGGGVVPEAVSLAQITIAINAELLAKGRTTQYNPVDFYLTPGFPKEGTPRW